MDGMGIITVLLNFIAGGIVLSYVFGEMDWEKP